MTPLDRRATPIELAPSADPGAIAAFRILDTAPPGWETLLVDDPDATPAHRPDLWRHLAATLEGATLRFVSVEIQGRWVGGGAVFVRRRGGSLWVHALPYSLGGAPLAAPGTREAVDLAMGAALESLRRDLDVAGGDWSGFRPLGAPPSPAALGSIGGETRIAETSVVDLECGLERVWGRFERSARAELRQARGAGLSCDEAREALDEIYALHAAQARRRGGRATIPLDLARRLLEETPAGRSPARIFAVRDARRRLLSGTFFLDHPREIFAWWNGSREGGRARHAATLLYGSVLEWAAAAGRRRLNLGGSPDLPGVAAYKRSLGAVVVRYPVRWFAPGGRSPGSRAIAALQRWARRRRPRGAAE